MKDQLNRDLKIPVPPKRIISLVPSQTELLVDLGLEEDIVGITKFCVHPVKLRKKKKIVGGTKKVNFEKIKSLNPDIILCNKEENTEEMVLELEKIAPVHVSDIENIAGALEMIWQYGQIFNADETASNLIQEIKTQQENFLEFIKTHDSKKVAYVIWKDPWMVVASDTFIDHLLKLNNFDNVFSKQDSRYPEKDIEVIFEGKAELVLLSTEPYPFQEKHKKELQQKYKGAQIEIVDGEFFSWYGSRLKSAFSYFKTLH